MGSRLTACQLPMPASATIIRPARAGEASALTQLCIRAKAHWGYDAAFMAAAARLLRIRESEIATGGVLAAMQNGPDAPPAGVAVIVQQPRPGWCELTHLFVTPENFGLGIGRTLFHASIVLAAAKGAAHVSILSDPNAAGFYAKLGARHCGEAASGVERGRMLPLFEYATVDRAFRAD
jgi:predicted N-acetyltransferase YhbS